MTTNTAKKPAKAPRKPKASANSNAKRARSGKPEERSGWAKVAIIGGVVAIGTLATAALLSLGGSSISDYVPDKEDVDDVLDSFADA